MKILIVEDEPRFSDIIEQGLEEQGITVDLARDGVTGLKSAQSDFYDAVILDVMLPRMNGFQVLQALRGAGCKTPVLMLTARSGLDDRVKGLDLGADDYLPKPFAFKELMARLRAITRRPQVEPAIVFKVADLELNLARRDVCRGGQRIDLTNREFALLELLMRHRGEVVTKAMIMNQVWGSDDVHRGGSNVSEVYINYLRGKVDQPFPRPLIHTVRGSGYLLEERE